MPLLNKIMLPATQKSKHNHLPRSTRNRKQNHTGRWPAVIPSVAPLRRARSRRPDTISVADYSKIRQISTLLHCIANFLISKPFRNSVQTRFDKQFIQKLTQNLNLKISKNTQNRIKWNVNCFKKTNLHLQRSSTPTVYKHVSLWNRE